MMRTFRFLTLWLGLGVWLSLPACAQGVNVRISPVPPWPGEFGDFSRFPADQYVFMDYRAGEWVAYFPEDMNRPQISRKIQLRFGSHAEIKAAINAHVERLADGSYSYTVQNGLKARSPIERWVMAVPMNDSLLQAVHPSWGSARKGTRIVPLMNPGAVGPNRMVELEWVAPNANSFVAAGGAAASFSLVGSYRPGFTMYAARGRATREFDAQLAASLPKPVADQLLLAMSPAWDSQRQVTLGPWFPPNAPLLYVAANFRYGITRLTHFRLLDHNSPFVTGAVSTLGSYIESGADTFLDPERMEFLSSAAPGLESEIANAIRLTLTR